MALIISTVELHYFNVKGEKKKIYKKNNKFFFLEYIFSYHFLVKLKMEKKKRNTTSYTKNILCTIL